MDGRPPTDELPPDCSPMSYALAFAIFPALTLLVVSPMPYGGYWAARVAITSLVVILLGGVWVGRGERTWLRAMAIGALAFGVAYGWVIATHPRHEFVSLGLLFGSPVFLAVDIGLPLVLNLFALAMASLGQRDRREWLDEVKRGEHPGYRLVPLAEAHAKLPLFLRYRTHVGWTLCRAESGEPIARVPFV